MDPITIESAIGDHLRSHGFDVEPIRPDASGESPDFFATDGDGQGYLIEVKVREDANHFEESMLQTLESGEVFSHTTAAAPKNRFDAIVAKAASQLSIRPEEELIRILWVVAVGFNPQAKVDEARATLFGTTQIFEREGSGALKTCYYFTNSSFHRNREWIDGAVVGTTEEAQLCVNSLSSRADSLRCSALQKLFGAATLDPDFEESEGAAFVIHGGLDRSNTQGLIRYLQESYGLADIMPMDLASVSATVGFGRSDAS